MLVMPAASSVDSGEYGQQPLEARLVGGLDGFKAGKTVRALVTHHMDVGAIKAATLSWVPPPAPLTQLLGAAARAQQRLYGECHGGAVCRAAD